MEIEAVGKIPLPLAFNPQLWFESLVRHLSDIAAGREPEEFIRFLDTSGFLSPNLRELRDRIDSTLYNFNLALRRCEKEKLEQPLNVRAESILRSMGFECESCGFKIRFNSSRDTLCPKCGGRIEPKYIKTLKKLGESGFLMGIPGNVLPEAALLDAEYDDFAQACIDLYMGIIIILRRTAEEYNQPRFILHEEARRYIEGFILGKQRGESRAPRETKQLYQTFVLGALAGVPPEEMEPIIKAAAEVLKYGYMGEGLGVYAEPWFEDAVRKFHSLWDPIFASILSTLGLDRVKTGETKEEIVEESVIAYVPCWLLAPECWLTGKIGSMVLEPVDRFPIFPKRDMGSLQVIFGQLGSGKTFLLSSIICYSILRKHEIVFVPLNDKSNSFSFASIPIFPYNSNALRILKSLKKINVEPQGVPTLTLTVLTRNEAYPDRIAHPPTIYDRVIRVDDARSWHIDMHDIVKQLGEVSSEYGFTETTGIICIRNMDRLLIDENINIDVQVMSQALWLFEKYRKSHLKHGARVVIDEISYLAPSQAILYAPSALRSGATISDFIKESRRNRVSIDAATQRILEVLPEIRSSATNVFFRDLPASKDKMRSEIDFMLDSMQLKDESMKEMIREINSRGELPKYYWFWYHRPARSINIIKPVPPTFCPQDPNLEPIKIFRLYEKQTGRKMLLKSWSQVPTINAEPSAEIEEKQQYY